MCGFCYDATCVMDRMGFPASLLVPLSAAAANIFCLCPRSPMLVGMGGLFQSWNPSTDLPMNGVSMDKFSQMNGLRRNTDF